MSLGSTAHSTVVSVWTLNFIYHDVLIVGMGRAPVIVPAARSSHLVASLYGSSRIGENASRDRLLR